MTKIPCDDGLLSEPTTEVNGNDPLCKRACADPEGGPGVRTPPPPPWNFGKNVVIGFVNEAGFILHRIYVEYNPD